MDDVGGRAIDARKYFGYSVPLEARAMKKKAYIMFTAESTYVITGDAPRQPQETARIEISRDMAARMKRIVRKTDNARRLVRT